MTLLSLMRKFSSALGREGEILVRSAPVDRKEQPAPASPPVRGAFIIVGTKKGRGKEKSSQPSFT